MSDILPPPLTPKQIARCREYFDMAARPFFSQIARVQMCAGYKFTIAPSGEVTDQTYIFTLEQAALIEKLHEGIEVCRKLAMNAALDDMMPQPREQR